jgi:hypothetical protein
VKNQHILSSRFDMLKAAIKLDCIAFATILLELYTKVILYQETFESQSPLLIIQVHSLIHSFIHVMFMHSYHPLIRLYSHSFIHVFIYSFTFSHSLPAFIFTHSLDVYSFIHYIHAMNGYSFICSFTSLIHIHSIAHILYSFRS